MDQDQQIDEYGGESNPDFSDGRSPPPSTDDFTDDLTDAFEIQDYLSGRSGSDSSKESYNNPGEENNSDFGNKSHSPPSFSDSIEDMDEDEDEDTYSRKEFSPSINNDTRGELSGTPRGRLSVEQEQEEEDYGIYSRSPVPTESTSRGRGRPSGSKNKPKEKAEPTQMKLRGKRNFSEISSSSHSNEESDSSYDLDVISLDLSPIKKVRKGKKVKKEPEGKRIRRGVGSPWREDQGKNKKGATRMDISQKILPDSHKSVLEKLSEGMHILAKHVRGDDESEVRPIFIFFMFRNSQNKFRPPLNPSKNGSRSFERPMN